MRRLVFLNGVLRTFLAIGFVAMVLSGLTRPASAAKAATFPDEDTIVKVLRDEITRSMKVFKKKVKQNPPYFIEAQLLFIGFARFVQVSGPSMKMMSHTRPSSCWNVELETTIQTTRQRKARVHF